LFGRHRPFTDLFPQTGWRDFVQSKSAAAGALENVAIVIVRRDANDDAVVFAVKICILAAGRHRQGDSRKGRVAINRFWSVGRLDVPGLESGHCIAKCFNFRVALTKFVLEFSDSSRLDAKFGLDVFAAGLTAADDEERAEEGEAARQSVCVRSPIECHEAMRPPPTAKGTRRSTLLIGTIWGKI